MGETFLDRHRGPFSLNVTRWDKTKPDGKQISNAQLPGSVAREDVEAEALALLTDPRDCIVGVAVWSEVEQQFIGAFPTRPKGLS